ncbi:MAG: choice-of-anchor A family protein [Coleofasciculus sp. C1-SOL-03]|jgi:choice-of-anchor A domain-containing protein|uniref:choice-of-anchor A family protein n=1 Tax=Coleofasciculus sp. C1-SOL-03 TaxID=3069522 RepID=UPI003303E214
MNTQTFSRIKQLVAPLSIAATMVLGISAQANAIELGIASDYNVFVLGDVNQSNTDAEGKVAVGGNADLLNFYAGMALPTDGNNGDVLIVGKNLVFENGQVRGNAVYGETAELTDVTLEHGGMLRQDNPIDFAAARQELQALSQFLGGLEATGTTDIAYGGITLNGSDEDQNIFHLNASDLSNASNFNFNVASGATAIVNISGDAASLQNFDFNFNGGIDRQQVLYNFYEAEELSASGIGIQGSVLAPFAAFNFDNGQINGNLIAASLTGGGQSNNYLFNGELPDPIRITQVSETVPEPATLAGLGLVAALGVASRRKGKQKV